MLGRTALKALVQEDRGTTVETSLGDFILSPFYCAALRRNPAYYRSVLASMWLRRSNFEQAHLAAWPLWLVFLLRPLTYVWWRINALYARTPVNSPPSVL